MQRHISIPRFDGHRAISCYAQFFMNPLAAMSRLYAAHGPAVLIGSPLPNQSDQRVRLFAVGAEFNRPVLRSPEIFKACGVSPIRGPEGSAHRRLRHGIVHMTGEEHAYYRNLFSPPFKRSSVNARTDAASEIVRQEVAGWPVGQSVDLSPLISRLMRQLSLRLLFGEDNSAEAERAAAELETHCKLIHSWRAGFIQVPLPGLSYHRMLRAAERSEAAILRWAALKKGMSPDHDLLSAIVNSPDHEGMSPSDTLIAAHTWVLYGASYETSAASLNWILFLLAQHPRVASDLLDELDGVGSGDTVQDLPLLNAVIQESMRLIPPVPYQARRVTQHTELCGIPLAKKSYVLLSPFMTNRVEPLFPNPTRFRPSRWFGINPTAHEFPVFSAGPRRCIGYWFAMSILKLSVAEILRRYRITIAPGARIDTRVAVTLTPKHGLPATIEKQDGAFRSVPVTGNIREIVDFDELSE